MRFILFLANASQKIKQALEVRLLPRRLPPFLQLVNLICIVKQKYYGLRNKGGRKNKLNKKKYSTTRGAARGAKSRNDTLPMIKTGFCFAVSSSKTFL